MRMGLYERLTNREEPRLAKIPINSSTLLLSSQGHEASVGDSALTSAPTRLPYHGVLMTSAAIPGEPTGDGMWQAYSSSSALSL